MHLIILLQECILKSNENTLMPGIYMRTHTHIYPSREALSDIPIVYVNLIRQLESNPQ